MEQWQWILLAFLFLLPMGLMIDFWGDERVTFRGRPIRREWIRQVEHAEEDDHH